MQSYINDLNEWTEKNMMKMNAKKTKLQIFNFSKKYQFTTNITLQNEPLEIVNEKRILGVYLTSNLKWDKQVDVLIKSANIRMRWLHAARKFTEDRKTSFPYFGVKLSCVCLRFAYRKTIAFSYLKVT